MCEAGDYLSHNPRIIGTILVTTIGTIIGTQKSTHRRDEENDEEVQRNAVGHGCKTGARLCLEGPPSERPAGVQRKVGSLCLKTGRDNEGIGSSKNRKPE